MPSLQKIFNHGLLIPKVAAIISMRIGRSRRAGCPPALGRPGVCGRGDEGHRALLFILMARSRLRSVATQRAASRALPKRLCCGAVFTCVEQMVESIHTARICGQGRVCECPRETFSLHLLFCCCFGALGSAEHHQSVTKLFARQVPGRAGGIKSRKDISPCPQEGKGCAGRGVESFYPHFHCHP